MKSTKTRKKTKSKKLRSHPEWRTFIFLAYAAIVAALALTGCQNSKYRVTDPTNTSIENPILPDDVGRATRNLGNGCFVSDFSQPKKEISNGVDILFVPDTSRSVFKEREAAANGIDNFVASLPADSNYRVAVMLAHGSTSKFTGKLYSAKGEPSVLDSNTHSREEIRTQLRAKLTPPVGDPGSDGGEMGMFTLLESLKKKNLKQIRSQGFFRNDASLAVVFIADENDICASYPAGVTPVPDPNGQEIPVKKRDCKGVTAQKVFSSLKTLKREMPVTVAGIVYTPESIIKHNDSGDEWSVENEIGYGYLDVIRLANGLAIDLASGKIAEGLASIGRQAALRLSVLLEFPIDNKKIDPSTIEVTVDGKKNDNFRYEPETNHVHLAEAGQPGSKVEVKYCIKK
jgi:hypothetical protein